ncbi:hypothetical protein Poli38472_013909 [Pythium oligandrum]|uniref:RGS domain-containing protein n=1 Tax=Pythium oligandrum TaxID=41045 RepID=A0A8K1C2A9_PYTOL|nr:hypothetical protein Poli38472_013909 [Pythium oligandrum]|eukprot:TMW55147.1 hypothetical protein Poli38472_013909 [Pythium oligandrum]
MELRLTLEDVARDAFRRRFFLDAFDDEREALELCFAFLLQVRRYKQLVGQREALQHLAQDVANIYLRNPPPHLCVFLPSPAIDALIKRILASVDGGRSPLDVFNGIEAHVKDRLERERFPTFLTQPQYQDLCDAIRTRREIPLGEILVDQRRTRYLEQFLQQTDPTAIGNLLFWVQVQTAFLPLIQTTLFSVALFEEIQSTVRRLFNLFLTEGSQFNATLVPDTMRKEILKRIMTLQGEPFSPPRYANLFRQAQDKIWQWMQTTLYSSFQNSAFYVLLVVEIENLESDRQLRRLSDHVQSDLSDKKNELKQSSVIFPVEYASEGPSVQEYSPSLPAECVLDVSPERLAILPELTDTLMTTLQLATMVGFTAKGRPQFQRDLVVCESQAAASDHFLEYVSELQDLSHARAAASPANKAQPSAPSPTFHSFVLPRRKGTSFGYCLTTWHSRSDEIDTSDPTKDEHSTERQHQHSLPRFAYCLFTQALDRVCAIKLLRQLQALDTLSPVPNVRELLDTISSGPLPQQPHRAFSQRFLDFYLESWVPSITFPIHHIFRELSHQTVVSVLGSLLCGKSLVMVSQRSGSLLLAGQALLELLKPIEWKDLFLPFCPLSIAPSLVEDGVFASPSKSPFIVGFRGELVHLKLKESTTDQRHRIRNSLYSTHRASLQLQCGSDMYPEEVLRSPAIVLDIDADDLYIPEQLELPELPQSVVRQVESWLTEAMLGGQVAHADSRLFRPSVSLSFLSDMAGKDALNIVDHPLSSDDSVRLAAIGFLEALFGDVVFHFCSFRKAVATQEAEPDETYVIFEADAYLEARIELGCRDFFRHSFQTELFRQLLMRYHKRFSLFRPANVSVTP